MKHLEIKIIVKKWKSNYSSKWKIEPKENLIKGDFTTSLINEKCITDITYIYTLKDGWCYLASVFDCYRAKIVGWHMSKILMHI